MPDADDTTPRRIQIPRTETVDQQHRLAHATVTRDEFSGLVTARFGSVDQWVALADDPAVLLALLSDASAQITVIASL
jgi:hypothetical protein